MLFRSQLGNDVLDCAVAVVGNSVHKIASGEFSTEKSVKSGKGFLVLVAADASENTKKKFRNMCEFYEVPVYFLADKEELGKFCGKEFRASLAVQDENFAKAMLKELEKMEQ